MSTALREGVKTLYQHKLDLNSDMSLGWGSLRNPRSIGLYVN